MVFSAPHDIGNATLEQLRAIPEDERFHEVIDGHLVRKAESTFEHGHAISNLSEVLGPFRRASSPNTPGGWWFATDVEILFEEHQIYRPDHAGWRRDRSSARPTGSPVTLIPQWVCEVLSTNRSNDLVRKLRTHHRSQVEHYWILDPDDETLMVERWTPLGYLTVLTAAGDETVRAEPFDTVELRVADLFGDP
jgi:Uma2 family endonuclease